ncbi:hypothetical protein QFZ30_000536 [Arthrobacter pascens]|uniref:hypothetical protein n=1 Tax=Arthrobacter pascens TaxID=1677 RepID=UPI00278FEAA7|nr:hypothetical protein [Arthrobacter pascens]MDQ0677154.1 hypothetical protein [Arthrobacter pascens]
MGTYSQEGRPAFLPHIWQRIIMRFLLCIVAGVGLCVVVGMPVDASTGTGQLPAAGLGLRLLDAPSGAANDPRAQLYIVDHLAPGTVIQRRIEVSNGAASSTPVVLYSAAATVAGGSFLGAPGDTPNDLSTWTSVDPGTSTVPAGGNVTATVTIAVPADAAPGEQYGVVWAEARVGPVNGGGVTQVSRVGIRLYLSVGPGGAPAANFTVDSLTAERTADGRPSVLASVHNNGGRALDMFGTLELSGGPGGLSAGPFPASLGTTVAIGATESVTIVLDKQVPAGPWEAEIILHSGRLERRAQATITFPDAGSSPPAETKTPESGWLYVAVAVLTVLLLGTAAWLQLRYRRRRRITAEYAIRTRPMGDQNPEPGRTHLVEGQTGQRS